MNNFEVIDSLTDKNDFVVFLCYEFQSRMFRELVRLIGSDLFLQVAVKFPGAMRTPHLKRLSNLVVVYKLALLKVSVERAFDRKQWFEGRQLEARFERLLKSEGYGSEARRTKVDEAAKKLVEARTWWNELEVMEQTRAFSVKY